MGKRRSVRRNGINHRVRSSLPNAANNQRRTLVLVVPDQPRVFDSLGRDRPCCRSGSQRRLVDRACWCYPSGCLRSLRRPALEVLGICSSSGISCIGQFHHWFSRSRSGIAAFIASSVLTASWLPLSINTFRAYLSPNSQVANSPLLPLLSLWTLIIATLVLCGIALFRSSQA